MVRHHENRLFCGEEEDGKDLCSQLSLVSFVCPRLGWPFDVTASLDRRSTLYFRSVFEEVSFVNDDFC